MTATGDNRLKRGFTLIEMLVMIMIIAILSSVAVPRYYDFAMKSRFHESVLKVVSVFTEARNKAIQSGADCIVRFDPQNGAFIVESEVAAPGGDQPVALQEQPDTSAVAATEPMRLGEDIIIGDFQKDESQSSQTRERMRVMEIRFHEDGRAEAAMIELQSSGGDRAVIEITPLTGRAAIREEES